MSASVRGALEDPPGRECAFLRRFRIDVGVLPVGDL